MKAAKIKRGATFKAALIFDPAEWAEIFPWSAVEAEFGQGSRRTPLAVAVDAANRTMTLTATPAQTSLWLLAPASFDVWVTKDGDLLPLPSASNVPLVVIQGVSR